MDFDLKKLRLQKNIPAKDMVSVVKELYPKYDKTTQSKCENGAAYGICLRQDALKAVFVRFAPEHLKERKKNDHRLTCRISCRLETVEYDKLQQNIKSDGFTTMQDWLTEVVKQYNCRKENYTE